MNRVKFNSMLAGAFNQFRADTFDSEKLKTEISATARNVKSFNLSRGDIVLVLNHYETVADCVFSKFDFADAYDYFFSGAY